MVGVCDGESGLLGQDLEERKEKSHMSQLGVSNVTRRERVRPDGYVQPIGVWAPRVGWGRVGGCIPFKLVAVKLTLFRGKRKMPAVAGQNDEEEEVSTSKIKLN